MGEAIHDARAPHRDRRGGSVVQAAWCRGGGSGARQPGPGLAVRPVCFRRVFGFWSHDLAHGDDR